MRFTMGKNGRKPGTGPRARWRKHPGTADILALPDGSLFVAAILSRRGGPPIRLDRAFRTRTEAHHYAMGQADRLGYIIGSVVMD